MDGEPLHKCDLSAFSERSRNHLRRACELHATMEPEDWESPKPHGINDIPKLAQIKMQAALSNPGVPVDRDVLSKNNFNPDQLRGPDGKWGNGYPAHHQAHHQARHGNLGHSFLGYLAAHRAKSQDKGNQEKDVATHDRNSNRMNRFFDTLDAKLTTLSTQLKLPPDYIAGLSALESEYLNDHNRELNNPLGLTHSGGPNVHYDSIDSAIAYWKKQYGEQVRGATSPEDFVQRCQGKKNGVMQNGWHKYNSEISDWETRVRNTINSIGRRRTIWQHMREKGQ